MIPAEAPPAPSRSPTLIALIVAAAFFMELLDALAIAPAIPEMARSFGTTAVAVSTGISSYLITVAIFIPASAWLADRFGARNVFAFAIALFTLASVLCGFSETVTQFTLARILQGVGGAMMSPVGRIEVLRRTEKPQLLRTIAFLTWPGLSALVIGPLVGGFLTTYVSWRWIFFINVPIGLIGIALVLTFFEKGRSANPRQFDAIGFVLNGAALATLIFGIESVSRHEPAALTLACLGAAAVLGYAAIRHARAHAAPLLSLTPFETPSFAVGTLWGGGPFRLSASGAAFIMPVMFQVAFGMSAFAAGLLVGAFLAGDLGIKVVANRIVRAFGFRGTLIWGTLLVALVSVALILVGPETPLWIVVVILVALGATRSVQFTALNSLIFADLPPDQIGSASALNSMSHQVSSGLGVGVAALALTLSSTLQGGDGAALTMFDFRVGLTVSVALVLVSLLTYLPMPSDTGSHVTGHKPRR